MERSGGTSFAVDSRALDHGPPEERVSAAWRRPYGRRGLGRGPAPEGRHVDRGRRRSRRLRSRPCSRPRRSLGEDAPTARTSTRGACPSPRARPVRCPRWSRVVLAPPGSRRSSRTSGSRASSRRRRTSTGLDWASSAPARSAIDHLAAGRREPGEGFFLVLSTGRSTHGAGWPVTVQARAASCARVRALEEASTRQPVESSRALPYVLLHSLSHLLITAVSLECGYSASVDPRADLRGPAGLRDPAVDTGSPDSEGTLGGWSWPVGRIEGQPVRAALELGRLCSNDPVCAQHQPDHVQEERLPARERRATGAC